ncbi:hypothetical protein [Polaromonas sp. YR568]|uniref:hypothetical protein n=1 Tax=Polaromonas sp. YR568 TaxID=1855301 RepID=UPI00398C0ECC
MNICPHCREAGGIKTWEKRFSSRGNPVTCKLCGGLSHVLASSAGGTFVVTAFLFLIAVLAGALSGSWLVGLSVCLLAVAYNLWAWQREALWPIPKENAQAARRANWVLAAVYLVIAFFS